MKRGTPFLLAAFAALLVFGSCKNSQKAQATANRKEVKGTWVLDKITFDGLPAGKKFKITLLDEGFAECLEGSTWNLPNNGFGSYTIAATTTGCTPGERKINWSYRMEGNSTIFQYKLLEEGVKAKNITEGYKLNVIDATETSLHLQSSADAEGTPILINYLFTKAK